MYVALRLPFRLTATYMYVAYCRVTFQLTLVAMRPCLITRGGNEALMTDG